MNEVVAIKEAVKKWAAAMQNVASALAAKDAATAELRDALNFQDYKVIVGDYLFYLDEEGEIAGFEKADCVL